MRLDNSLPGIKTIKGGATVDIKGVKVKKGGTTDIFWNAATPWSVSFLDYPISETNWDGYSTKTCTTTSAGYSISTKKNENVGAYGTISAQVALPTQSCNKVKIKYSANYFAGGSPGTINGVAVNHGETDQYLIFDCVGDEFVLELGAMDNTAYYAATIQISEISFYYE